MSNSTRILMSLVAGVLAGTIFASLGAPFLPRMLIFADAVGKLWLDALRMTIVPLIFALVVNGVASAAGAASMGRLAGRALLWFTLLLAASAVVGAILTPFLLTFWPPPASAAKALGALVPPNAAIAPQSVSLADWLGTLIPVNPVSAAANGAILQIVLFGLAFGFSAMQIGKDERIQLVGLFRGIGDTMLVIVHWVLWAAPVGVFFLALGVGARTGFGAAGILAHYIVVISTVCLTVMLLAYPLAVIGGRVAFARFCRAAAPSQMVAISTQSSLASLPAMIEGAQDSLGIPPGVAGLVLPMAVAIFRASSPAANLAVAIYLAHVSGIPLSIGTLAAGSATAVAISLAGVGVASSVTFFSTISPICLVMGVPLDLLPLLIAVETIPDIFRTVATTTTDLALTSVLAVRYRNDGSTSPAGNHEKALNAGVS